MKQVKILFLSNSFGDDTIQYMPEIALDFGYELDLYNLHIGGCDINKHIHNIKNNIKDYELRLYNKERKEWETKYNVSINEFIVCKKWDFVVLQQASYFSGLKNGLDNIEVLLDLVKKLTNKDVRFVWNMTWSYPKYSDQEIFKEAFECNQDKMHIAIVNNVKQEILTRKEFVKIIPNGKAIYLARKELSDELIHRDGFHLSFQPGRYLAGLTAVATLLNVDISKVKFYPAPVTEEMKNTFIKCVKEALEEPFEI